MSDTTFQGGDTFRCGDAFRCGDTEILVDFLYGEASLGARRAVAAHLAECTSCETEVAALRATRDELATWRPPQAAVGFHVTRREPAALVAHAWWQRPMPAWMQAAAAALVFAAGLAVGAARWGAGGAPVVATAVAPNAAAPGNTDLDGSASDGSTAVEGRTAPENAARDVVNRNELVSLERRLRAEMLASRAPSSASAPASAAETRHDETILRRVRALVQESEVRQQRELALRTAQVIRDFEIQRRLDMASVRQSIGQVEGAAGAELRRQQEMWNVLANRVGQPGVQR
jgi:hypothetical protein